MADRIADWATSPDRNVTVLAAPGGLPIEVQLSPEALRQRPEALAHAVLTAATLAGQRATKRLHRQLAATVGPEASRTLDRVGLAAPDDGTDRQGGDDGDFGGILARPL